MHIILGNAIMYDYYMYTIMYVYLVSRNIIVYIACLAFPCYINSVHYEAV